MREWQSSMLVCHVPYLRHCWMLSYRRIAGRAQVRHSGHKRSKTKLHGVSRVLLSWTLLKTKQCRLFQIATHILTLFRSVQQPCCRCNLYVHEFSINIGCLLKASLKCVHVLPFILLYACTRPCVMLNILFLLDRALPVQMLLGMLH